MLSMWSRLVKLMSKKEGKARGPFIKSVTEDIDNMWENNFFITKGFVVKWSTSADKDTAAVHSSPCEHLIYIIGKHYASNYAEAYYNRLETTTQNSIKHEQWTMISAKSKTLDLNNQ